MISGYTYEFEYHLGYTRATSIGTLTFQFTSSVTNRITDIEAIVLPAGGQNGAYVQTGTGTTVATTATGSISSGTTGVILIKGIVIPASNMKLDLQLFQSAGTTTPKKNSWYKYRAIENMNSLGNIA